MKSIASMSRLELAAFVAAEFRRRSINVVLSGGSCVSIYSAEKYVSMDLDFVNAGFAKRSAIKEAMQSLGFSEKHRYFRHPNTPLLIEFPPGPLGVGEEPVKQIDEITTDTGVVRRQRGHIFTLHILARLKGGRLTHGEAESAK